jgi:flagellar hook assembly protein FlgD
LVSGVQAAGGHTLRWDGRDRSGRVVGSGLYFVRLEAAGRALIRRLARL